jgi:hypothetical protein
MERACGEVKRKTGAHGVVTTIQNSSEKPHQGHALTPGARAGIIRQHWRQVHFFGEVQ